MVGGGIGLGLSFFDAGLRRVRRPGTRAKILGTAAACGLSVLLGVAIGAMGQMRVAPRESVELSSAPERAKPDATPEPSARREANSADDTSASSPESPETPPASKLADKAKPAGKRVDKPTPSLTTRGVSVQVLNAARSRSTTLGVVGRLRRAGFNVAVINPAAVRYRRTTVFWSRAAGKPAAVALAERYGWKAAHKPRNLSRSVTIHVVVGTDEMRGAG
jgi:hypothetical protein